MRQFEIIQNRVNSLFSEKLHLDVTSVETDLIESGILDSLRLVELLLELEELFGTKIPLSELEIDSFRSIARIADFVVNHEEVRAAPAAASAPRNRAVQAPAE